MQREAAGIKDDSKTGDEALLFGRRYWFVEEVEYAGGGDSPRSPVVICGRVVDNAESDLSASMPSTARHEYVMESEWLDGRRKLLEREQQEQFHSQSFIGAQSAANGQSAAGIMQSPVDTVGAANTRSVASVSQPSTEEQSIPLNGKSVEPVELSVDFSSITAHSPAGQKLALFRSLFHGREDVFARKWVNTKKGTKGFSPACARIARLGCSVRQVAWCPDIAVFDDRLAWYGSLPLLGLGARNADDCAMRAVDRDMSKLLISNLRQGTRPLLG